MMGISRPAVLLNSGILSCYYADMNTSLSACHNDSAAVCGNAQKKGRQAKRLPLLLAPIQCGK